MPIYEYHCENCQDNFDVLQGVNDEALKTCSKCGKASLTKMMSAPHFQLKGTGWYETDFKTKKAGGAAEDSQASKPATETKTEPVSSPSTSTKTDSAD